MLIKVGLHPDVVFFVRHRCNPEEQKAFFVQLHAIRSEPITNSEAISDPRLSRYMLRFFRFGRHMAVFHFDPNREQIKVLECRTIPPKRVRKPKGKGKP